MKRIFGLASLFVLMAVGSTEAQYGGNSGYGSGMGMKGGMGRDGMKGRMAAPEEETEVKRLPPPEDVIQTKDNSVPRQHQIARGFIDSGLIPHYPAAADCPPIASPFASPHRFDGSDRTYRANYGLHSGLDISLPIGTPLLAVAGGTLIHKASGGKLTGNQVIIQHAPQDTGYPVWLYSLYKHFDQMPEIPLGSRVETGQVIGPAGRTGTQGKHYGDAGYPHLHWTVFVSDSPDYFENRMGIYPKGNRIIDPLAIYSGKTLDSHQLKALPDEEKMVAIPYQTADGRRFPSDTRLVWPVACHPKQ